MSSFSSVLSSCSLLFSSGSMKWRKSINLLAAWNPNMNTKKRPTSVSSLKMERSSAKQSVIGVEKSTKSQTFVDERPGDIVQRIRDSILKAGIAVSSPYDTAWVAMVPSPDSPGNPCFPECLKWILENQKSDGSWDSSSGSKTTTVVKEALSSTLACVLALKRWNVNAHEHIDKVPTAYPFEVYTKLCIIDSLQKLGIDRYFSDIVENFFSEIYRLWVENDEEIYSDITTRAMAFRLLRMHGYEVSSAVFENLDEDRFYCSSIDENLNDMKTILELYNASYAKLSQDDKVLEKLNSWTSNFLEQKLVSHETHNEIERIFFQEVNHALKFPSYANLERNEHKRNIENFALHNIISMKKSFKIPNTIVDDMLRLAVNDFTTCQSLYRNELDLVERYKIYDAL